MSWKGYPEYKNIELEWLDRIPKHWDVKRLKRIVRLQSGTSITSEAIDEIGDYPVYGGNGLRGYTSSYTHDGDFVLVGRQGALCGCINYAHNRFWASEHAVVATPLVKVDVRWLGELLRAMDLNSYSQSAAQPGLAVETIAALPIPVPPDKDQWLISDFLEKETSRIDSLIEKKERQIELLKEKRSALVHDAIHDPSTRSIRIGHVADRIFRPIARRDDEVYTPVGLFNRGRGIFHKEPTAGADLGDSIFFWIKPDDLILSGQFAWEGAVALASEQEADCVASHRYPVLRGKPNLIDTAYLFAFFTTKTGDFLLNEHSRGAAGRNRPLNAGTLLKEPIPVPPIEAQALVSAHVYYERKIEQIIARSVKSIEEYRTALMNAAVTGKIDIRKEAA